MRAVNYLAIVLTAAGCSAKLPTQAGGKPVSHWLQELKNPDAKARRTAVEKLGNVGATDPAALPAVRGALADPDEGVRMEAVQALMKFGPAASEAEPELKKLQKDDRSPQVRDYAAKALEHFRSQAK